VLDGMRAQRDALAVAGLTYYPYVEPHPGAGHGLLEALSAQACAVVTDAFPAFFLPRMVRSAGARLPVQLVEVDSNGLVPLSASGRAFSRAHAFRRHVQKVARASLNSPPAPQPLRGLQLPRLASLPPALLQRWPAASDALLDDLDDAAFLALPIDHAVPPVPFTGGADAAAQRLAAFVADQLPRYADQRNHPDACAASGLSPWLHFGHIGVHELLNAVFEREQWTPDRLSPLTTGQRHGFWNLSPEAEAFVDELVTWRELGYHFCHYNPHTYDTWQAVPSWARQTLDQHAGDPRPGPYTFEQLEAAQTDDPLWNAAQRQLRADGVIQNYLRMLWGKNVLAWAATPEEAFAWMVQLNNRWAIDGRDPNSWTGILWTLGAFDRAWGPERPVFGKVRFMTSASTQRKLRMRQWLNQWS